ncbi:FimV/HubP family polar landmark protein [Halochromatium sp.]
MFRPLARRSCGYLLGIIMLLHGPPLVALGLGELRTQSALNQPFYGEIDLFDLHEHGLDSVKVSLASRSAFERTGIERPHFLTRLQFTPMLGPSGEPMIQVISREPVREPFLDLLVEVIWPDGRLVKEYSVLLDPPVVAGSGMTRALPPSAQRVDRPVQSPFAAAAERSRSTRGGSSPVDPAEVGGSEDVVSRPPTAGAQRALATGARVVDVEIPAEAAELDFPLHYGPVPAGAGLATIARRLAPPGATLEQTAMALYRNSQAAFIGSDINRLRVGAELRIPTAAELFALGPQAARQQYLAALAGRPVVRAPLTDIDARLTIATSETIENAAAERAAVGRAPVEDANVEEARVDLAEPALPEGTDPGLIPALVSDSPPEPVSDVVSALAPGQSPAQALRSVAPPMRPEADAALEAELLLMREVSEANRQEAGELRTRVQELEAQLDDIRRLLELRNAQLASLSQDHADSRVGLQPGRDDDASAPVIDGESGVEREPEPEPESASAQTPSGQKSAPAVDERAVDPAPAEGELGFDPLTLLGDWRQRLVSWALPLLAAMLLLALLALMLHRRRQQATAVAAVDSTDDEGPPAEWAEGQGERLDELRLDPEWPIADAPSASSTGVTAMIATRVEKPALAAEQRPLLEQEHWTEEGALTDRSAEVVDAQIEETSDRRSLAPREALILGPSPPGQDLLETRRPEQERPERERPEQGRPEQDRPAQEQPDAQQPALDLGEIEDQASESTAAEHLPDVEQTQMVEQEQHAASTSAAPMATKRNGSEPGKAVLTELDGLAEAEVYLTYGRYADAERVLRETMAVAGESAELRYKLAETYLAAGDLAALALLADQMRRAAEAELDRDRWTRIESALAGRPTELDSSIDAAADDDDEELFLDLDDLEENLEDVGQIAATATSQPPSGRDQAAVLDGSGDDRNRLDLDLAALDAMTNEGPAQARSSAPEPEPEPEPEPAADLQTLGHEDWTTSDNAADLQWPILATLPDEDAVLADPTDSRSLPHVHGEAEPKREPDPEPFFTASAPVDSNDSDLTLATASEDGPEDERGPLDTNDGWDEMGLKLDLARAYLDMDDPDAARAILNDVLAEGRDEQRREAESLLAGLD